MFHSVTGNTGATYMKLLKKYNINMPPNFLWVYICKATDTKDDDGKSA
jgi:hypothetical protein